MNKKFKKIILSWWFWVLVAIGSYLLFILTIPWESWFGGGRTFLAYLTQIAWIIAIVIIIVDAIKWIQKTKIGDYWKISFTILGIIGIIVFIFFAFSDMGIFWGETKFLKDQNYEVLDYGYNDVLVSEISPDFAYVEMKALGSREDQVDDGWIFLGNKYKDASKYTTIILTENKECRYSIDGEIYRAHLFGLSFWSTENPILMNKIDIEEKLDYIIWVGFLQSELSRLRNNQQTEKELRTGVEYGAYEIEKMLEEEAKLNNPQIDRETIWQIQEYYLNDGFCE